MTADEYLEQRLEDQIRWYGDQSGRNKKRFNGMRTTEIVAAACIPFLAGFSAKYVSVQIALGVLGVVVAVLAGMLALNQHQELWVRYRSTAELLKRQKFLYLAGVAPYDGKDAFTTLVLRVEALTSEEGGSWSSLMGAEEDGGRDAVGATPR